MKPFAHVGRPFIYAISEGKATSENLISSAERIYRQLRDAIEGKVSIFQIREKQLSGRCLFELAAKCSKIVQDSETKLLINDRVDVAVAAGTHGVHMTFGSIPTSVARRAFGNEIVIGRSVHNPAEAVAASKDGSDFVVFGPVFDTPGKGAALGLDALEEVCALVAPFPVLALGGIDPSNFQEALRVGAAGVAGIRSFSDLNGMRSFRNL
jgi:thiamine-phosphate pyrophosphorylase